MRPLETGAQLPQETVLRRGDFLRHLQLEKRRSDRSHAPLSLIVFQRSSAAPDPRRGLASFAVSLWRTKRETDVVGWLSEGSVALLLPHTDGLGANACMRNAIERGSDPFVSATVATYPDALFENLADPDVPHDEQPLLLDLSKERGRSLTALKRVIDVTGAVVLLVVASPLMLVTAALVSVTSPGPVIFRQVRLGKGGAPFNFYKFRSMYVHTDDQIHRQYVARLIEGANDEVNQGDEGSPYFKIKGDPRITPIGGFIRSTSIDELPQLFNVLKGDMSLVGPRPPLPYEAEKYRSWHLRRVMEIRPGITGLWQVEGRSRTTFDEMVRLDLKYIRNWTPLLDMKIMAKTLLVVLRRDGAD